MLPFSVLMLIHPFTDSTCFSIFCSLNTLLFKTGDNETKTYPILISLILDLKKITLFIQEIL